MNKREWRKRARKWRKLYNEMEVHHYDEYGELDLQFGALSTWQRRVRETLPEEYDLIAVGTCHLICLNTDDWLRLCHAIEDEPEAAENGGSKC